MKLYKIMGQKLNSYLTDLRKAQIDSLKEGFDEIDGIDPNKKSKAPPSEPTITTNINPQGAQTAAAKKKKGKEDFKDPAKTCNYCGKFDPKFDEESLDLHAFQECPVLIEC